MMVFLLQCNFIVVVLLSPEQPCSSVTAVRKYNFRPYIAVASFKWVNSWGVNLWLIFLKQKMPFISSQNVNIVVSNLCQLFLCRRYCFIVSLLLFADIDSMRWFSHRRSRAREDRCRTKCRTFSFFLSPVTLAFDLWPWHSNELGRDFGTLHLAAKFRHFTFNRSEVIVLTNKQTDWQTDAAENVYLAPLCCAGG